MQWLRHHIKRIVTDIAGYALIILGIAFGWVPGPGGIPLILAGLGLLSINNAWAKRLRIYILRHGGKVIGLLFPRNPLVEWLYDILAVLLLGLVAVLAWRHDAWWQISLASVFFVLALLIALLNRDRIGRSKRKQ